MIKKVIKADGRVESFDLGKLSKWPKCASKVDGKIVQGLLKVIEKHRKLTMVDKFVFFLMVVLASPIVFIVLTVMKKRGGL